MTPSFSTFSNSLLFNYWKSDRDSILNDFLRETIPFIFSENTGYTAYSATTYNEEDIVKEIKSITFKEHPHFESTYSNVSFSLLLKMHNEKCIGHYGAQVSFSYKSVTDLNISLNDLKDCYLDFPNTQIVSLVDNIIEISNTEDKNWPSSVYLKTATKTYDEHLLIFSATDLFLR
jgi:hypothetical protein